MPPVLSNYVVLCREPYWWILGALFFPWRSRAPCWKQPGLQALLKAHVSPGPAPHPLYFWMTPIWLPCPCTMYRFTHGGNNYSCSYSTMDLLLYKQFHRSLHIGRGLSS